MEIKLFLSKIMLFLLTFLLIYLGFSFVKLSFDFTLWSKEVRLLMLLLGSSFGVLKAISLDKNYEI